jgi:nucleotide-binding universal stress UspA family protein
VAGTIVVGVDGSAGSRAALRWAVAEAALRGVPVDAVITWQSPTYAYTGVAVMPPVVELADAAKGALEETVEAERSALPADQTEVVINQVVAEGPAASILIERSRDADLLVVGSRGFGGFRGLLLGSVSHQCASHAHCPVVVVPSRDDD